MSNWVNLDVNFGDPYAILVIGMGDAVKHGLRIKDVKDDPQQLEKVVTEFIVKHRPELAGLILSSMEMGLGGKMQLRFVVIHPSLPRTNPWDSAREERLLPCPICHKILLRDAMLFRRSDPEILGCGEEVCSEQCATKTPFEKAWAEVDRPLTFDQNHLYCPVMGFLQDQADKPTLLPKGLCNAIAWRNVFR